MLDVAWAAARERAEAATPGPWHFSVPGQCCSGGYCIDEGPGIHGWQAYNLRDLAFIVNARTDLPAALDALDAAEATIAELREQLQTAANLCARSPLCVPRPTP